MVLPRSAVEARYLPKASLFVCKALIWVCIASFKPLVRSSTCLLRSENAWKILKTAHIATAKANIGSIEDMKLITAVFIAIKPSMVKAVKACIPVAPIRVAVVKYSIIPEVNKTDLPNNVCAVVAVPASTAKIASAVAADNIEPAKPIPIRITNGSSNGPKASKAEANNKKAPEISVTTPASGPAKTSTMLEIASKTDCAALVIAGTAFLKASKSGYKALAIFIKLSRNLGLIATKTAIEPTTGFINGANFANGPRFANKLRPAIAVKAVAKDAIIGVYLAIDLPNPSTANFESLKPLIKPVTCLIPFVKGVNKRVIAFVNS